MGYDTILAAIAQLCMDLVPADLGLLDDGIEWALTMQARLLMEGILAIITISTLAMRCVPAAPLDSMVGQEHLAHGKDTAVTCFCFRLARLRK